MNVLLLTAACVLAAPAEPEFRRADVPLAAVVDSLIRDLGAEPYHVRERATRTLHRIGSPALEALRAAAKTDDPEVRVRAREILRKVELGIGPDWPAEIILLMRHYDQHAEHQRYTILQRIQSALGAEATPFLLRRIAEGSQQEANYALNFLQRSDDPDVARQVLAVVGEPKNDSQRQAVSWARARTGAGIVDLSAVAAKLEPKLEPDQAVEDALRKLGADLGAGKLQAVADAAARLATKAPADPRPLYLQAQALAGLDKDREAAALRTRALALNSKSRKPHYAAAMFLLARGLRRLATGELERLIEIADDDKTTQLAAYVHLAIIHTDCGLCEAAAGYIEKVASRLQEAKDKGQDPGVDENTLSGLQTEVNRLRQRASSYPAPQGAVVDAIPERELAVEVQAVPTEGTPEDFQQAIATADLQIQLAVHPPDLKLFDVASASLAYAPKKKELTLLLAEKPACAPFAFAPGAKAPRVAVHAADCTWLFLIDPAKGQAERIARFEKDYRLTLRPGTLLRTWGNVALTINGRTHSWDKALKGLPLPRLPEQLAIRIEGSNPLGRRMIFRTMRPVNDAMAAYPQPKP